MSAPKEVEHQFWRLLSWTVCRQRVNNLHSTGRYILKDSDGCRDSREPRSDRRGYAASVAAEWRLPVALAVEVEQLRRCRSYFVCFFGWVQQHQLLASLRSRLDSRHLPNIVLVELHVVEAQGGVGAFVCFLHVE